MYTGQATQFVCHCHSVISPKEFDSKLIKFKVQIYVGNLILFTQDINLLFFISIKVVKHYKTNNLLLRDFAKGVKFKAY